MLVYLRYGREPKVDYGERYEREPPTDDPPAVVGAIISQKPSVGTREFTATLFDLIRRGVLRGQPVSVKQSGLLGEKTITDLRVKLGSGDDGSLEDFEGRVLKVARRVISSHGPANLTDFGVLIGFGNAHGIGVGNAHARRTNRTSYQSFREEVKREVERRDLVERGSGKWSGWAAILLGLTGAEWFVFSLLGASMGAVIFLIFSSYFVLAIAAYIVRRVFGNVGSVLQRTWVRRTPKGALLHARWQAFRRYLTDFSRMEESPPASLALWEQFLVYGIALGVAEQVLEAARLHAPPEIAEGSSFYSTGYDGYVAGPTGFSFSDLENDFAEAFTHHSKSDSQSGGGSFNGGGGSFSGGGGGGGGGGGAW